MFNQEIRAFLNQSFYANVVKWEYFVKTSIDGTLYPLDAQLHLFCQKGHQTI